MEENWVEVYSETLQHEALVRITDEIEKIVNLLLIKTMLEIILIATVF